MQTKQDAIISFSATVKDVIDNTKATVALEKSDIIKNCNTSIFDARKLIRDSLSILKYHRRHKEVKELVTEAEKVLFIVNSIYLQPYGDTFRRWFEHQLEKEIAKDENFLDELFTLQEMEKKCMYYEAMYETLQEVQKIYIGFSDLLQKNLNTLEPSEFELSKNKTSTPKIKRKIPHRHRLASSCEDLSTTSSDSVQFVPTTVSKSKTNYLGFKFGILTAGTSRTTSSESLNALSC